MITLHQKGDFQKTKKLLIQLKEPQIKQRKIFKLLEKYGEEGVRRLKEHTPVRTGETADSWVYKVIGNQWSYSIVWTNTHYNKNVNVAMLLQYGHGTRNGGYVQGIDYINPALKPIFDDLADKVWEEVTSIE